MSGNLLSSPQETLDLFNKTLYSDVDVHFEPSCAEKENTRPENIYHCHKTILSMKSGWFLDQLHNNPGNGTATIVVDGKDLCPSVFRDFLKVLYGYKINIKEPTQVAIERIIEIHGYATTKFRSPDVQAACCAALKVMFEARPRTAPGIYRHSPWIPELKGYINAHYSVCGMVETELGSIISKLLVEQPYYLKSAEVKDKLRQMPGLARDVLLAALEGNVIFG